MPIPKDEVVTITDLTKVRVLEILRENKDLAYNQKELAELTKVNQSTMSRTVERLMKAQKIWKRFKPNTKGRPTAYYCIRDENNEK